MPGHDDDRGLVDEPYVHESNMLGVQIGSAADGIGSSLL